jgi:hypothetical protein
MELNFFYNCVIGKVLGLKIFLLSVEKFVKTNYSNNLFGIFLLSLLNYINIHFIVGLSILFLTIIFFPTFYLNLIIYGICIYLFVLALYIISDLSIKSNSKKLSLCVIKLIILVINPLNSLFTLFAIGIYSQNEKFFNLQIEIICKDLVKILENYFPPIKILS